MANLTDFLADYSYTNLICMELSTPVLNARWALIKFGWTMGTLFCVVETLFGATFIVTRLFIYGAGLIHFVWGLLKVWDEITPPIWAQRVLTTLVAGGFTMNMVWVYKLAHAFKRSRRKAREPEEDKSK